MALNTLLVCIITIQTLPLSVSPFRNGAPRDSCVTLSPSGMAGGHKGSALGWPKPHTIHLDHNVNTYTPGQHIRVHIRSSGGAKFNGVFAQARPVDSSQSHNPLRLPAVGLFFFPDKSEDGHTSIRAMNCWQQADAITQVSSYMDLQNITFRWMPPSSNAGDIVFVATVMVDGDTWYVPIRSAVLSYKPRFVHNLPDAHTTRVAATAAVANGCKTITPKPYSGYVSMLLVLTSIWRWSSTLIG